MDAPLVTTPPESIMLPESPGTDREISAIKPPDRLGTPKGSRSDFGGSSEASSSNVELGDEVAPTEKKAGGATDTNDCIAVEPPDRMVRLEYAENEVGKADNGTYNDKPEPPIGVPEVSAIGRVAGHAVPEANRLGTTSDAANPSPACWVDEPNSPDNRVDRFSGAQLATSPVEPEHDVSESDKVDDSAFTICPVNRDDDDEAEINESQDNILTNTDNSPSADGLRPARAYQRGSVSGPNDRDNVEGCNGDDPVDDDERSSISRIVDYIIQIGTSIAGAPYTASGDNHDIPTDGHVSPITTQKLSPNSTGSPTLPETIDNEAHHAEVGEYASKCEECPSTLSGVGGDGTGSMSNASSSAQPMHGSVIPGPIKRWSDGTGYEVSSGQPANNLVTAEIIEPEKPPNDTNNESFVIVSTDVSTMPAVSEKLAVDSSDSSDGYSTNGEDLDTNHDAWDSRLLVASQGPLTPSSTISSPQAEELPGFENELEEEEVLDERITVFHDAVRFNVKHPLINKWTLWYTKPPSGKPGETWSDLLREIQTFDSVEEFWAIYNNVPTPSTLPNKSDYQLFKFGIRPEWEDPNNKRGGRFSFMFRERHNIDRQWLDVLLATIGETMEPEGVSEVQGVVANIRKGFTRISCWTRTTGTGWGDMDRLVALGKHFKAILRLNGENVDFAAHDESASAGSARARTSFSI